MMRDWNTSAGSDLHKDTVNSITEVVSWPFFISFYHNFSVISISLSFFLETS